jgi:hypothetical protein
MGASDEGRTMQRDAAIYVPGDRIRFTIEIEHVQNFTKVYADFVRRPEREEESGVVASISSQRTYLQDRFDDGHKISKVVFESGAERRKFVPGVYELRRVRGLTVMEQSVEFDVDERLKELRFQFALEPTDSIPSARPAPPHSDGP